MRFRDKAVVVTGAASGIGAATARLFAREGANLILSDISPLGEIAQEIAALGAEPLCVEGDLVQRAVIEKTIDQAVGTFGRLDVVIHNAATGTGGTVETLEESDLDRVWALNFKAAFFFAKYAVPVMRRQREGVLLFTGAVAGMYGQPNTLAYSTAKAALINFTKTVALDHARDGVRVNCVSPGPVDTRMLDGAATAFNLPKSMFWDMSPLGHVATPEDVAESFAFLASPAARSITGHVLVVDSGLYAGMFTPRPVA